MSITRIMMNEKNAGRTVVVLMLGFHWSQSLASEQAVDCAQWGGQGEGDASTFWGSGDVCVLT